VDRQIAIRERKRNSRAGVGKRQEGIGAEFGEERVASQHWRYAAELRGARSGATFLNVLR
jgi:hypothetical protein